MNNRTNSNVHAAHNNDKSSSVPFKKESRLSNQIS